jgi:Family of unknown function (DUF6058)
MALTNLDSYLAKHYLEEKQFADICGISTAVLSALIAKQLIPEPSYRVSKNSTVYSYVFGEMDAPGAKAGEYFHPVNHAWVLLAQSSEFDNASSLLKARFSDNFQSALAEFNQNLFRLNDSFTDDGKPIIEGLIARSETAWEHFLKGTFGLCIANPVSEYEIARKEILQEKLSALSESGLKASFTSEEVSTLLTLIKEYEMASMPFSPIEYSRSSRKRLVEDLRKRLLTNE